MPHGKTFDSSEGQMWIGSRSCRYQGYADVVLYGDRDAHEPDEHTGYKYLWASGKSVLELHGKEKKSWTVLDGGHIYQENTPTDPITFEQVAITDWLFDVIWLKTKMIIIV